MKPLPLHEKEYRLSLYRLERRAIIPIKWAIFGMTLVLWVGIIGKPPSPPAFCLFTLYFLFCAAQTYFFFFSEVTINQIKPLTLASYLSDVVFVTMLIFMDLTDSTLSRSPHHDFYLIYFLLVMRGFGLFKTIAETIFVNLLISIIYVMTFYSQKGNFSFIAEQPNFSTSLVLIWLVILMSWFLLTIITKQKMELLEVNDRLLRADNLSRVGELAAGVAHEINNPIGIIAATAEYLKMRTEPDDDRLEEIDGIYKEAMRCKDIVQQMLTYANPRPAGIAPIEPRSLNDEVLHFVFPKNRSGQTVIEREYDEDPPIFHADPNLIKQALLNLYINAKQAIPEGQAGRIVSRVRGEDKQRRVCFEIEDNGKGIGDEDIDHIFEPFFTRKAHGTGLGLAVTQQIVEKFGGVISVRSSKGKGSAFSISFPASQD